MKYLLIVGLVFAAETISAELSSSIYITNFSRTRAGRMPTDSLSEERDSADQYARASNLAVLNSGSHNEVRIWVSWSTFDPSTNGIATTGYVVTDKNSKMCSISYPVGSTVPKGGRCEPYAPKGKRERVLEYLVQLSNFSDFSIDCNVVDGTWVLIDAVSNGKRFLLHASNPQSCDGDTAKLVSILLDAVAERETHQ